MTSILDILKNKMTESQKYAIAIGQFFSHWHQFKIMGKSFFHDAQTSYQHMNITDAQDLFDAMCSTIDDILPTELQFIDQTSSRKSND